MGYSCLLPLSFGLSTPVSLGGTVPFSIFVKLVGCQSNCSASPRLEREVIQFVQSEKLNSLALLFQKWALDLRQPIRERELRKGVGGEGFFI